MERGGEGGRNGRRRGGWRRESFNFSETLPNMTKGCTHTHLLRMMNVGQILIVSQK